jgi:hypothetical protein
MWRTVLWSLGRLSLLVVLPVCVSCGSEGPSSPTTPEGPGTISSDSALFTLITQGEPFGSYTLFPRLAAGTGGILDGSSSAHQPRIRVSMNNRALAALQDGRLSPGATLPDGSIVFKEVFASSGTTSLYTVMYKDRGNSLAGNGWLWAEYTPGGGTAYSITNRGGSCTGCHSRGLGPQNDFVRSFERQQ